MLNALLTNLPKKITICSRLMKNCVFLQKHIPSNCSSGHVEVRFTGLPKKRRHNSKTFCSCSRSFQFWARRVQLPQPCRKFLPFSRITCELKMKLRNFPRRIWFKILFWRRRLQFRPSCWRGWANSPVKVTQNPKIFEN